ncbi:hypothetical protein H0H81_011824 [Sphagnurus paluster]|uniref:HNH nuclease domain-containing protein n=1 Tax=Sphagnurus paluster TaxID=117069 RepID=A0A9P7FQV4_9AGAR|nr:hypothetical protein H0H81_011824 [Sphagnurus paluster]
MTSLPPTVPARLQRVAHAVRAYNKCLRIEKSLQQAIDNGEKVGNGMIYVRILGYLIHHVVTDEGMKAVVYEITSCVTDRDLLEVGKMYFNHYIRGFRASKGRIPTPSNHASRPSFDKITDMIKKTLEEAPPSHATAKKHALIRDGYRCVVTGKYDRSSVDQIKELEDMLRANPSLKTEETQCAHIFAESTNSSITPGSALDYAATMWGVVVAFGYKNLPHELNGPKIHRLENVMTAVPGFHNLFDELGIWFTPTDEENKYRLEGANDVHLRDYPEFVTFQTPDPVKFPVPSPIYLAIHATCAKVAHLSGAAACIDKFYRDMEDSTTLDPDGGSADILEHALFELHGQSFR